MRNRYGVPYKGSKSRIVENLVSAIPYKGVDNFYDLFAGGCAVTHKVLLDGKYKHYYANDLDGMALRLFCDGIRGKYRDERRWISRGDFFALKDTDPYVACCWSFGNNLRDYLYSKKIEPYKKACHYAVVLDDFSLLKELCPEVCDACMDALAGIADFKERRMLLGPTIVKWLKAHGTNEMVDNNPLYSSCHKKKQARLESLERLQSLERLESLQSLERLQSLESLERLESTIKDYMLVSIKKNAVVYCDPPYRNTNGYRKEDFDYEAFYDWCCKQKELVLISEYEMPHDRFVEVWSSRHIQSLCATKTSAVVERLFVPKHQYERYRETMRDSYGASSEYLISIFSGLTDCKL